MIIDVAADVTEPSNVIIQVITARRRQIRAIRKRRPDKRTAQIKIRWEIAGQH